MTKKKILPPLGGEKKIRPLPKLPTPPGNLMVRPLQNTSHAVNLSVYCIVHETVQSIQMNYWSNWIIVIASWIVIALLKFVFKYIF